MFKELQVRIDGRLVAAGWPVVTIYTGGVNPLLWRPLFGYVSVWKSVKPCCGWVIEINTNTSIGASDVVTIQMDLTPFAFILNDGRSHTMGLTVFNANVRLRRKVYRHANRWPNYNHSIIG